MPPGGCGEGKESVWGMMERGKRSGLLPSSCYPPGTHIRFLSFSFEMLVRASICGGER